MTNNNSQINDEYTVPAFLRGGGEMGQMIRSFDWYNTLLGAPEQWPQVLKHMTSMMLNSSFPTLICWGPDYVQLYNDKFRPINGESKHPQALGGSARNTYSEIWETIGPMFGSVLHGESFGFPDFMVPLHRNGYTEDCYFDFSYSPIIDEQGEIGGVLVICMETTKKVNALNGLKSFQVNIKNIIEQAPVAMAIFRGPEFVIELTNEKVLEYWGRTSEQVMNRPLFVALPEASGQGFEELLTGVLTTGETFIAHELPVTLTRNGVLELTWINFIYDALRETNGEITGIIVVCSEVTEQVNARKQLEKNASTIQQALDSASIGTWVVEVENDVLNLSQRALDILGATATERKSLTSFLELITVQDRQRVEDRLNACMVSGDNFNEEFMISPGDRASRKWVRATAKVEYEKGQAQTISGMLIDITEQKNDDIRKNDFIGMVSHELKTPLTSLNAIVQVLSAKLKNNPDPFIPSALEKTATQAKKMTTMINGFLNISRLESGKMLIDKTEFDLPTLIHEVIEENIIISPGQEIGFKPCGEIMITADREKISSVISNLISNAVKYSPKGSPIKVDCQLQSNNIKVSVTDCGMGIRETDIPYVFDRYFRVEANYTKHISGFGIGLYLCAEIIRQHGGEIGVQSKLDKGSAFYFSLPLPENK